MRMRTQRSAWTAWGLGAALLLGAPAAQAVELSWRDDLGRSHTIDEYAGRPLLVHIWASWCPSCRAELPELDAWRARHPDASFIAVSIDASAEAARRALAARAPHLRLRLTTAEAVMRLGVRATPATLLIAPDGRIVRLVHGALDWSGDAWLDELAALAPDRRGR